MGKKQTLAIWSYRFTTSRGWIWYKERTADSVKEAQLWLDVFRDDEPDVAFRASVKQPNGDPEQVPT